MKIQLFSNPNTTVIFVHVMVMLLFLQLNIVNIKICTMCINVENIDILIFIMHAANRNYINDGNFVMVKLTNIKLGTKYQGLISW